MAKPRVTFTAEVKAELAALPVEKAARHCLLAEFSAIVNAKTGGGLKDGTAAADRFDKLLTALGFGGDTTLIAGEPQTVAAAGCCKAAYLRGLFLCRGAVSRNHFEVADGSAAALMEKLGLGLVPKTAERKGRVVAYLKEGEQIGAILGAMGAVRAMLNYENSRVESDVAGDINRRVNFQNANMDKTIEAAVAQLEDVLLIERNMGFSALPPELAETARLRLENPELSLKELGERLTRPVGKSGVMHRLRRLGKIAGEIREGGGVC